MMHHMFCSMIELRGAAEKENSSVKKGLLWQQRDRLFSRWKERYFVLTKDYLICFQKATKGIASSEMGSFIFKVSLNEVEAIEQTERKGNAVISISLPREGRLFLRCKSGLDDWLKVLRETLNESKGRREALRHTLTRDFHSQMLDVSQFRSKMPLHQTMSDCCQDSRITKNRDLHMADDHQPTPHMGKKNRLSLMTDVDLNFDMDTPPSTPSVQWSSSRTPSMSTPRGSLCQSRPPSRMTEESPSPPERSSSNGHACRSEPPHRRDMRLTAAPSNDRESLTSSSGYSEGRSLAPSSSFERPSRSRNLDHHHNHYLHHHRNMSGDLSSSKMSTPPSSNGTTMTTASEETHKVRNRRFSLANATELIHDVLWHNNNNNNNNNNLKRSPCGSSSRRSSQMSCNSSISQSSQVTNNHSTTSWFGNKCKTNGLISRVASDRHPMGRQIQENAYRARSGSDAQRPGSLEKQQWGSEKESLHILLSTQKQQMNIYTRL